MATTSSRPFLAPTLQNQGYTGVTGTTSYRPIKRDQIPSKTRYFDGAGNRNDRSRETLACDFTKHAMNAIAPAWPVWTTLAH